MTDPATPALTLVRTVTCRACQDHKGWFDVPDGRDRTEWVSCPHCAIVPCEVARHSEAQAMRQQLIEAVEVYQAAERDGVKLPGHLRREIDALLWRARGGVGSPPADVPG